MNKITSYFADYQTFPSLFELEPVAGKKVTVDFSAPELSSLDGLSPVREYEKSSNLIIERIESCIKDPRRELWAQRKIPVDLHFIARPRHKASGAALGLSCAVCFEQPAGVFAGCGAVCQAKILASLKIKNGISLTPLN